MKRKTQILGTDTHSPLAVGRSPLKPWGKLRGTAWLCLSLALSACGQKGPLYMPAPAGAASQPTTAPAP